MATFEGFSDGRVEMSQLPSQVFTELIPLIDDLAELKVLLFCFWALPQKEGNYRYLRHQDFRNHPPLINGLAVIDPQKSTDDILDSALEKAVGRQVLLCVKVQVKDAMQALYFVNTPLGRDAVAQIKAGKFIPGDVNNPVEILPPRPTIYKLYEDNIGMITPMIADELKDIEATFSPDWVEEALTIAVKANKRNLRYIRAILESWQKEGKDSGKNTQGHHEQDGERFIRGKYADFIDH